MIRLVVIEARVSKKTGYGRVGLAHEGFCIIYVPDRRDEDVWKKIHYSLFI